MGAPVSASTAVTLAAASSSLVALTDDRALKHVCFMRLKMGKLVSILKTIMYAKILTYYNPFSIIYV